MSLINANTLRTTLPWVDSYTMVLDSVAAAKNHHEIKGELKDAAHRATLDAKQLKTPEAMAIAANQQAVNRNMQFSQADFVVLKKVWRDASSIILAMDWMLTEETHFREETPKGPLRFWQGEDPMKRCCILPRDQASVTIKFLRFVQSKSEEVGYDPRIHVRKTLAAQGITKENFHRHVGALGITNPWLDG